MLESSGVDPDTFDETERLRLFQRGLNRADRFPAAASDFLNKKIDRSLRILVKNLIKHNAQNSMNALWQPDVFASFWIANKNSLKNRRKCD